MGDIFGDIFGNMFHGKSSSGFGGQSRGFDSQGFHSQGDFGGFGGRSTQAKGSDLHSEVNISFEDATFAFQSDAFTIFNTCRNMHFQ